MEASPAAIAAYEAALPDDARVERKQMFGCPCAFVHRQMFFGTFADTLVARIGPERVVQLAGSDGLRVFAPMVDRAWRDYIQADPTAPPAVLKELAAESLEWAARLPAKGVKPKAAKKKKKAD